LLQEALLLMSEPTLPALSVVVVAFNGPDLLKKCVSALIEQPDFSSMEVLVVNKSTVGDIEGYASRFANIHWHQVPSTMTIPKMRSLGIMMCNAPLLALLEDDCTVNRQWFSTIKSAHRSDYLAIGGAVEPGSYSRGLDWGVYYCEYARFLSPLHGTVEALPGNNVTYKMAALDLTSMKSGFYEVFLHNGWRDAGVELHAAEGMEVRNNNRWRLKSCTSASFHHGRAYAAQRFGTAYSPLRLIFGLLATLLPVIKTVRTLGDIASRKRAELPILKALPWIVLFHSCWSVGECVGYLTGPGQSIERWS
jgi:hypothetical protein